jgi:hypothetical protein
MLLPLLECFVECILFDGATLPHRIFLNLFNVLETMFFQNSFQCEEFKKVGWSQVCSSESFHQHLC